MSNQQQKWLRDTNNPKKVMCHLCGRGNLDPKKFSHRHINTEHPGYRLEGVTREIVILQNQERILREKILADQISYRSMEDEFYLHSRKRSRINHHENSLHESPSGATLHAPITSAEMEPQIVLFNCNEPSTGGLQEVTGGQQEVMNNLIAENKAFQATPSCDISEILMENQNFMDDEVSNSDGCENEKQETGKCYWKNGLRYYINSDELAAATDSTLKTDKVDKGLNNSAGNKPVPQFENISGLSDASDSPLSATIGQSIIVFFAKHGDDGCLIVQDLCTERNWEYKLQLSNLSPSKEIVTAIQQWNENNKIFSKNLETILHCQISIFGNINSTTFLDTELPPFKVLPTSLSDQELEDLVTNIDDYSVKDETEEFYTELECPFEKLFSQPLRDMLPTILRLRGGAEQALLDENNDQDPPEDDSNDQQAYGGKMFPENLKNIQTLL